MIAPISDRLYERLLTALEDAGDYHRDKRLAVAEWIEANLDGLGLVNADDVPAVVSTPGEEDSTYISMKDSTKRAKIARRGVVSGYRLVLTCEPGVDPEPIVATLNEATLPS